MPIGVRHICTAFMVMLVTAGLTAQEADTSPVSTQIDTTITPTPAASIKEQRRPRAAGGLPEARPSPSLDQRGGESSDGSFPEGEGVDYGAEDSTFTDLVGQIVHLYGNAFVRFEDVEVTADYIRLNLFTNEVEATFREGKSLNKPQFVSGAQTVKSDRLVYNINTEQGIVENARIRQDQLYIHGAVTKFKRAGSDSLHIDDVIYNRNALITTCDHDHPHWGIRTSKFKMIPEKLAVIGPMDMELGGIPTPLAFPFAFAPLFSFGQSSSGIIFPDQDPITIDPQLGFGTRGLGYHFAFSEMFNLSITGDIYTRGSWALRTNANYRKRYKYSGSVDLQFSRQLLETATSLDPNRNGSFSIRINHRQDSKAHPYRTIGGNLNFSVNDFDRRNSASAEAQLNSQINSNFNYSYQFTPKLNFSAGISHSQNTLNRDITFTLPNIQVRLNKVFPFKNPNSSSANEKWYEKINVQYNSQIRNSVSTKDTILFTSETLERFRAGVSHTLDVNASYKMFKYFNFNTTAEIDEYWYLHTIQHSVDSTQVDFPFQDSIERVSFEAKAGFKPIRDVNVRAGISTNVFGTLQFAKGWLRGIRHRMTPSVNIGWQPGNQDQLVFYDDDPFDPLNPLESYNPFQSNSSIDGGRLFQSQRLTEGGAFASYSIDNVFEGKYWSKKDSTEKKFKLVDRLSISGNYNFGRDSLNWSDVSVNGSTRIFKKTTVNLSATLTPYVRGENGLIDQFRIANDQSLLGLERFNLTIATSLTFKELRDLIQGTFKEEEEEPVDFRNMTADERAQAEVDRRSNTSSRRGTQGSNQSVRNPGEPPELYSWFENFSISHNFSYGRRNATNDFEVTANSIQIRTGRIPLSDKWDLQVNNISYDFKRKQFVYPAFTISRQLHCWNMRASWQPASDTYTFFIGVSASPFNNFLKYQTGSYQFTRF